MAWKETAVVTADICKVVDRFRVPRTHKPLDTGPRREPQGQSGSERLCNIFDDCCPLRNTEMPKLGGQWQLRSGIPGLTLRCNPPLFLQTTHLKEIPALLSSCTAPEQWEGVTSDLSTAGTERWKLVKRRQQNIQKKKRRSRIQKGRKGGESHGRRKVEM